MGGGDNNLPNLSFQQTLSSKQFHRFFLSFAVAISLPCHNEREKEKKNFQFATEPYRVMVIPMAQ